MTDLPMGMQTASAGISYQRVLIVFFALVHGAALLFLTDVRGPQLYDLLSSTEVTQSADVASLLLFVGVIPAFFINLQIDRPSKFFALLIYFALYIPCVVISPAISDRPLSDFISFLLAILLSMIVLAFPTLPGRTVLAPFSTSRPAYIAAVAALNLLMLAVCVTRIDIDLTWRPLNEIYDVRETLSDAWLLARDPLLAYSKQWLMTIAMPALLALGLLWRRHWATILAVIIAYICYQAFAEKAALANGLAVGWVFLSMALSKRIQLDGVILIGSLIAALTVVFCLDYFFQESLLLATWYMRSFLTPGLLTSFYFDYFTLNPFALFGDSALGALFGTRASMENIPLIIGSIYVYPGCWANANFWADGYANLGIAGIVLATVVLRLLIAMIDALAVGRDIRVVIATCTPIVFALANTALQRAIASNGLWLLILFVLFLPVDTPTSSADRANDSPEALPPPADQVRNPG